MEAFNISEGGDMISDLWIYNTLPLVSGAQRKGRALPIRVMADFRFLICKVGPVST